MVLLGIPRGSSFESLDRDLRGRILRDHFSFRPRLGSGIKFGIGPSEPCRSSWKKKSRFTRVLRKSCCAHKTWKIMLFVAFIAKSFRCLDNVDVLRFKFCFWQNGNHLQSFSANVHLWVPCTPLSLVFRTLLGHPSGPVTKIENIKTDSTKILRPTHFSGPKDIKTDLTDWPVSNWRIRPKI